MYTHSAHTMEDQTTVYIASNVLQCSLCLSTLVDPRLLPCQHTYCEGCLKQHIAAHINDRFITCPECRELTLTINGNVDDTLKQYLRNVSIGRILDNMTTHSRSVPPTSESSGKASEKLDIIKCPVKNHTDLIVEYLCKDHDSTGCVKCFLEKHRHCKEVCAIADIVEGSRRNSDEESLSKIEHLSRWADGFIKHEENHRESGVRSKIVFERTVEDMKEQIIKAANSLK